MSKLCLISSGLPSPETMKRITDAAENPRVAIVAHGYDKRNTAHPDRAVNTKRHKLSDYGLEAEHFECYAPHMRGRPFPEKAEHLDKHGPQLKERLAEYGILYLLGGDINCTMTYRRVLRLSGIEELARQKRGLIVIAESLGAVMCSPSLEGIGLAGSLDTDAEQLWEGMHLTHKRPIPHANWKMAPHRAYKSYITEHHPHEALPLYDPNWEKGPYEDVSF